MANVRPSNAFYSATVFIIRYSSVHALRDGILRSGRSSPYDLLGAGAGAAPWPAAAGLSVKRRFVTIRT